MMNFLAALEGSAFPTWLRESGSIWAYPTVLTAHTVGLAMLVGANAALDLRVLGVGKGVDFGAIAGLFKVMWLGFWLNAASGVMLFAADATTKGTTVVFMIKLSCIAAAVIVLLLLKRAVYGRRPDAGVPGAGAKALALLSLALWVCAITTGRFMAYPGLLFGL